MNIDELNALRDQLRSQNTWSYALSGRILGILLDELIARVDAENSRAADTALLAECYVSRYQDGAGPVVNVMHKPTHLWAKAHTDADALTVLRAKLTERKGTGHDHH